MSKLKKLNKLNKSKTLNVALSVGLVAANLVSVVPAFAAGTDSAAKSVIMSTSRNSLSATSASYDKKNGGTLSVTYTAVNGATLSGIKNGIKTLTLGTDYTKDTLGTTVTFTETYLKSLRLSTSSIKFDFNTGYDPIYRIKVTDTSAKINRASVIFDANHPKDISVSATTNGNTFQNVTDASGNAVTVTQTGSVTHPVFKISKDYLATLPNGIANLTFNFDKGTDPVLKVTVKNSKVAANALSSVTAATGTAGDTVTANFSTAITDASSLVLAQTINGTKVNDYSTKTFTLAADGKSATVTVPSVAATTAAQSVVYSVTYKGVTKTSTITVPASTNLVVSSVSATNAKEVTVVFNSTVDKTTAETATNYTIPGRLVTPVLQADNKTVLLTVNTALALNTATSVTVNNVKSADLKQTITSGVTAFTPVDTTIPSVSTVSALSPVIMEVTFSEPVQVGANTALVTGNFTLDNAALPGGTTVIPKGQIAAAAGYKVYDITLPAANALTTGDHTLVVNANRGIVDYAGFIVPTTSQKVTVVADTTAPQIVSATVNSRTELQVVFNKPVDETTLNGNKFYWNTTGNAANNANTGDAGTVAGGVLTKVDSVTYKIPFTTNYMSTGTIYVFNANTITDLTGNPFPTNKVTATVAADVAPKVDSLVAVSDKILEVHFNKAMSASAATGALNKLFYTFKNSAGSVPVLGTDFDANGNLAAGANITLSADGKIATIVFGTALPADTYSVAVATMQDAVGVAMTANTLTVTPADSTPIAAGASLTARSYSDGTYAYFVVTFPEAMATSGNYSVLTSSKWSYDTKAAAAAVVAPATAFNIANATITASADKKVVTIKAPIASWINANYYSFGLSNVADISGNVQTAAVYTPIGVPSVQVNTAVSAGISIDTGLAANALKITDPQTITMTLPKQLQALDAADFSVVEDVTGTPVTYDSTTNTTKLITNVTYVNNADGTSTVTVTMNKALDITKNIAVGIKNNATINTIDADGLALVKNITTATTGAVVGVDYAKVTMQPNLKSVSLQNATTIDLLFDQNIAIANPNDFIVTDGGTAKSVTGATATGNHIALTFAGGTFNVSSAPMVSTVAQSLVQTEGAYATKLVAVPTPIAAKNVRVTSVLLANGEAVDSATAAATDKITISFSDAVSATSLGFVTADYVAATGEYVHVGAAQNIASTQNAGVGAGNEDTSTLGVANTTSIGTLRYFEAATTAVGGADAGAGRLDSRLSADGKTLTLTFTAVDGTATITNANITYTTLLPAATITDAAGNFVDSMFNAQTSTKF